MLLPHLSRSDSDFYLLSHVPSGKWRVEVGICHASPQHGFSPSISKRSRALFVKRTGTAGPIPVDGDECRLPRLDDIWGTRKLY